MVQGQKLELGAQRGARSNICPLLESWLSIGQKTHNKRELFQAGRNLTRVPFTGWKGTGRGSIHLSDLGMKGPLKERQGRVEFGTSNYLLNQTPILG